MSILESFATWLADTQLSAFLDWYRYPLFPLLETVHFIGLTFLVGGSGVLDLRLLGMAKQLPLAPLHRLMRWAIFGFVLCLISGLYFFVSRPNDYIGNLAFLLKMLFLLIAGISILVFYLTVFRETEALGPGEDAPQLAKIIAAISLFCWVAIMFCGRLIGV